MASMSRRAALALPALIALPVLATDLASQATTNPDAQLLSLCRRFMSLERRQNYLFSLECEAEEAGDEEMERWLAAVQRRYVPYGHSLRDRINDLQAQTAAGIKAKARVCMTLVSRDADGNPTWGDWAMWSLCRDLLGGDPGEGAQA